MESEIIEPQIRLSVYTRQPKFGASWWNFAFGLILRPSTVLHKIGRQPIMSWLWCDGSESTKKYIREIDTLFVHERTLLYTNSDKIALYQYLPR